MITCTLFQHAINPFFYFFNLFVICRYTVAAKICPLMSAQKFVSGSLAKKQSRKTKGVKRTVCNYGNNQFFLMS